MATRRRKTTRKRKRRSRSRQQALPGWVWMLFGLAVGLAVAAAIYVNDRTPRPPAMDSRAAPEPRQDRSPASADSAPADEDKGIRFDFYDMLPKFEVVIPEEDLEARPDVAPAPVAKPGAYVLQAGSFSAYADADRMKARLALLGIVSRIQKVSVDDKTYHRVRVGPVSDLDELNNTRRQLRDAQIEVMVIRVAE
ncbi:MAG: SPOR domain-containing protein [Gammaproteobacteria bacterium]|nr:SPOR domain-containing protein [Gammaproteobacteria bacterium]